MRKEADFGHDAPFAAPLPYEEPHSLRPWPLLASLVAILVFAAALAGIAATIAVLVILAESGRRNAEELVLIVQFNPPLKARLGAAAVSTLYLCVAAATVVVALAIRRRAWRPLLALTPAMSASTVTLAITAATLAYAAVASFTLVRLQSQHPLLLGPTDYVLLGTAIANLVCLAPLAEELFFRGWIYTALRDAFGFIPAFAVTAAAFVAFHFDIHYRHMLLVLPLALALGFVRESTGSIRPTIALHATYNLIMVAVTLTST